MMDREQGATQTDAQPTREVYGMPVGFQADEGEFSFKVIFRYALITLFYLQTAIVRLCFERVSPCC